MIKYDLIGELGTYVLEKKYWTDTPSVGGCRLIVLTEHADPRGYLTQIVSERNPQATHLYYSQTMPGHARDGDRWHYHLCQTDRFVVVKVTAIFALSDGRDVEIVEIFSNLVNRMLLIPPEVYHCVRPNDCYGAMALINCPDRQYDPDDEKRTYFTDANVPTPWYTLKVGQ